MQLIESGSNTMKIYKLTAPPQIEGRILLPTSKSISNRALILDALAYGDGEIDRLATCDDTRVLAQALNSNHTTFDIGAAGTAMRFLTAYLSKIVGCWTLTGSERMQQRPIGLLVDALNQLGGKIEYVDRAGYPPLRIYGSALQGGDLTLNGGISSQFISALLMLAPTMERGLRLTLSGEVISTPYIQMTLGMMHEFGVKSSWTGNTIEIAPQTYRPTAYTVEGDWSAASYWFALVALADKADVELLGLHANSLQGDACGAALFEQLGVVATFTPKGVRLTKSGTLPRRLEYDFSHEPDLVQTFVVVCCQLGVRFRFAGLTTLKIKETDRVAALIAESAKLGFHLVESEPNVLTWEGERIAANDTPIHTYDDHRMAMAFAPVALKQASLRIAEPDVVSKSYPAFWNDLTQVGFTIVETDA